MESVYYFKVTANDMIMFLISTSYLFPCFFFESRESLRMLGVTHRLLPISSKIFSSSSAVNNDIGEDAAPEYFKKEKISQSIYLTHQFHHFYCEI